MDEFCPDCNAPLDFDGVDIGVGVQRGNYRCPECEWESEKQEPLIEDGDDDERTRAD